MPPMGGCPASRGSDAPDLIGVRFRVGLARLADGLSSDLGEVPGAREIVDRAAITDRRARSRGGFDWDTPWAEAERLAVAVVGDGPAPLWWGDPCAGTGRLLVAALEHAARGTPAAAAAWHRGLRSCDLDAEAAGVSDAATLASAHGLAQTVRAGGDAAMAAEIARAALERPRPVVGDFLDAWTDLPVGGFIVTNPPFESIRAQHRRLGAPAVRALRARFEACRGAFDSGVPVMARVLDLAAGGRVGAVVPATWLTAEYAEPLRARLAVGGPWWRLAGPSRPFGAAVNTLLVTNAPTVSGGGTPLAWTGAGAVAPAGTVPMSSVAAVSGGTAGFDAARVAAALAEGPITDAWPFVASGSIGRYGLRDQPARLMGRRLRRPWLPTALVGTEARRRVYANPKVVVPGIAKRLRGTWVDGPCALSVGVIAIVPDRVEVAPGPWMEAVVNSSWASDWLAEWDPGAGLSGGYRRFSCRALRALPVPDPGRADVAALIGRISAGEFVTPDARAIGGALDNAVSRLYRTRST